MKLKKFSTKNFAGLKDREYTFKDGMNVLYGKNEAGKSTIIDAIYNTLFKNAKLHKSSDKDFIETYFPIDATDTIDSSLLFEVKGHEFEIEKSWGANTYAQLMNEQGKTLQDQEKINKYLRQLFEFGPATYKYILFSSQKYANPLLTIFNEDNIKKDVVNFLSRTVMELDGVSIDGLEKSIINEIESLTGNWDIQSNRPKNNRGISNPYVKGVGLILKAYYDKETLKNEMILARKHEDEFEKISIELNGVSKRLKELFEKKKFFDESSEDIRKRSEIERDLKELRKKENEIKEVLMKWPALEQKKKTDTELLEKYKIEEKNHKTELEKIESEKRRREIASILNKYEANQIAQSENSFKLEPLLKIKSEFIEEAETYERQILINNSKLTASQLVAKLSILDDSLDIKIQNAVGEDISFENNERFDSGGYLKLCIDNTLEFEVNLKELDVDAITAQNREYRTKLQEIYKAMDVESLDNAKVKLREKNELENQHRFLKSQEKLIIGDLNVENLRQEIEKIEEVNVLRPKEEIDQTLLRIDKEIRKLEFENIVINKDLNTYQEKYISNEEAFKMLSDTMISIQIKEDEISTLKKLPERYESSDDFFNEARRVSLKFDELTGLENQLKIHYNNAESKLPEVSFQELKREQIDKENEFIRLLNHYKTLERIKEAFYETKNDMESNPMAGLFASMEKYLSKILRDSVKISKLGNQLNVEFVKDNSIIGYKHLSKGTRDSIALALRLSLLENLFSDNSFIVLDDILNDLDIERREATISILKDFAANNQILFTTCNPETAKELGGNLIEIA